MFLFLFFSRTLTPGDSPFGATTLMNGKPLPGAIGDGTAICDIPVAGEAVTGAVELPPISVTFAVGECVAKE